VARALEELPLTAAAMARGELSFCKVRALTRVARPETEADLLELAAGCTTAQLEIMVRAWRKHSRLEEAELERERYLSRRLAVFPDDEGGMYVVKGRLVALQGAIVRRGIEWASDILYREERAAGLPEDEDTEAAAARRQADAICWLVERAMTAGPYGAGQADGRGRREGQPDRDQGRHRRALPGDAARRPGDAGEGQHTARPRRGARAPESAERRGPRRLHGVSALEAGARYPRCGAVSGHGGGNGVGETRFR
jgi:hypothetical protein